jgi:hypothetical protein
LRVERITEWDIFATTLSAADFSARRHRRRHIEDDGPMFAGRRRHAEWIGAEKHLLAAPGRHGLGGIGEHHGHQPGFDRRQCIGRRHAEMRAAPHRNNAYAKFARHGDGFVHRPHADNETETVLTVERSCDWRHMVGNEIGFGIDHSLAQHVRDRSEGGKGREYRRRANRRSPGNPR